MEITNLPGQTIGIIGGGQLGRMMALSAREMGYKIAVLDPTPSSPCGQIADVEIVASFDDLDAIKKLADVSDVITYEFENIDGPALNWLENNANLPQGSSLLITTQNRLTEKKEIEAAGLKVAPYYEVNSMEDLQYSLTKTGYPAVLKTTTGGYDGKGQLVIRTEKDVELAKDMILSTQCVLEKWMPFDLEVSVIVTRNVRGEIIEFPIAENIHKQNILHLSIVPARVNETIKQKAIEAAHLIADHVRLVGTLAVEMFVVEGDVFINELAPRPHNSGHYSIEGCETSQFHQHIRAICNWPLASTKLIKPSIMVNILGEHVEGVLKNLPTLAKGKLHLYGKEEAKVKRKMGHMTFLTENVNETLLLIEESRIWDEEKELIK